jgi:predicted GNAT superfamily acetyltransferase
VGGEPQVILLDRPDDLRRVAELFTGLWGSATVEPELARALAHTGGYVAGVRRTDALVGASVGFLADDDGHPSLHSHVTGVAATAQGAGVGLALKRHQRAWALDRGLRTITWTFDPLVRRNAWFNLMGLGADVVAWLPDFYGRVDDRQTAGQPSDRVMARWVLEGERARAALEGRLPEPDLDAGAARGGRRLPIPPDIVELRRTRPAEAAQWQRTLRQGFGAAMDEGWRPVAITRTGCYLLEPGPVCG